MLDPLLGRGTPSSVADMVDVICLFALILGMAAALGAGILTMAGGIESIFGLAQSGFTTGLITLAIVGTFVLSSVSGLHRGIRFFSTLNMEVLCHPHSLLCLAECFLGCLAPGCQGASELCR